VYELVKASAASVSTSGQAASLPVLVERAGGAARFAWEEFFYAEHHNPHAHRAYERAVRRFLAWAEGQGVELAAITPGMVGQYLVGLGGSPAKRNQHLAALRGFFDRLVQRHVVVINPAASVSGVKEQVVEGKTPEITLEQTRKLVASIKVSREVKNKQGEVVGEAPLVVGLRDRAILSTMRFTACRAGAVAKLTKKLTGKPLTTERICELVKRRLKDAGLPKQLSPHSFRVAAITDLFDPGCKIGGRAVPRRAHRTPDDRPL